MIFRFHASNNAIGLQTYSDVKLAETNQEMIYSHDILHYFIIENVQEALTCQ